MPQLDLSTFASQIFWLVVTFGVLYLIMARSALPVIREVLQTRQTRIFEDLRKAEKLKEEAESAEADFTSVIVNARGKASNTLAKVREKASAESEKRHAKLDDTFSRQAKESEHRIEIIKKEAVSEMVPVTVEITREMVKKLVNIDVDNDKIEKLALSLGSK
jgi:F-type H+-transporting ATPase subunit b